MAVKTEIMTQKVANSSYDAIKNAGKLAKIVKQDLSGSKWSIELGGTDVTTLTEDDAEGNTITMTYTNPEIKANSIEAGKPAKDGEVQYEIVLTNQDASLGEIQPPSDDYLALKEGDTVYYKDASDNDIECTVLYASKDKTGKATEYFKSYGVQIIPRNPVAKQELGNGKGATKTDATNFNTAKGIYNDAINILNTAAKNYVAAQPNLAAIAESSRCVGSLPSNKDAQNTAMYSHTEGTNNYFASYDGQFNAGEEDATYTASNITNYTVDKTQLDSLEIATITDTTNGSYYWLASRSGYASSNYTDFYARRVDSSGSLNTSALCYVDSRGSTISLSFGYGLRPCITLKSNVKVTERNGNKYLSVE